MKLFISTADESDDVPKVDKDQPTYGSYKLSKDEWELLMLIHQVLVVRYIAILFHHYYLHVISRLLLKFRKHSQLSTTPPYGGFFLCMRTSSQSGRNLRTIPP